MPSSLRTLLSVLQPKMDMHPGKFMSILALSLVVVLVQLSFAQSQTSLKILSFNLHGMAPGSDPSTRLVHIIQNLEQLDPDIVGLQEINQTLGGNGDDNQGKVIADSLTRYFGRTYYFYNSATHAAWDNTFLESIGIISRYPILDSGFASLAVYDFPRKVVWGSIETPAGTVQFFNTHLSGPIAADQVQQIMQYIRAQEQIDPGIGSILTGDFNSTPESEAVQLLVGNGSDTTFADTYHEANPSSPGYTVPAGSASSRIDFVFYHRSGALNITASEVVLSTPFAPDQYCSDHYGVMTTFVRVMTPSISAPPSYAFPTLMPGLQFRGNLMVSNTGIEPLQIESVTKSSSAFQLVGLPHLPVSVARGGTPLNIGVVFAPNVAGTFIDTLIIISNDPAHPRIGVALRGKCLSTVGTAHPGVLYASSTGPSNGMLHIIDPATGLTTTIGPTGIPGIHSLAIQPSTQELYGVCVSTDSTWLYRIATQTGDAIPVFVVKEGNIRAIAFGEDDVLYGATTGGELCKIDIADGTVSPIGNPFKYSFAGICMSPYGKTLWACPDKFIDSTYQIDPLTGEVHYIGVTGFSAFTRSLAFGANGTLYALIDDGYNVDYIATLDTVTASGITANPTVVNSLSAIAMSLEPLTSVDEKPAPTHPANWTLDQNYPNPFNPITRIKYTIGGNRSVPSSSWTGRAVLRTSLVPPKVGRDSRSASGGPEGEGSGVSDVTLIVYDVLGRQVAVLVNERKFPGNYEVALDGSGLSSGVYIYRLSAGLFVQARTMVLIK
jgi:endonuclease/exonuclease/phosphatase family metal-dependent hydrolase